jgi:uncharacterized membrane protein
MEFSFTAKPNRSLPAGARRWVVLTIAIPVFGIASGFAWLGLYWVLPFAGLEVLALLAAFYVLSRRDNDFERLSLSDHQVLLECMENGRQERLELNRFWTEVKVRRTHGEHGCRLTLQVHGKEYEFGRLMTDAARIELAEQLQQHLKS